MIELPWDNDDWLREARDRIDVELAGAGLSVNGYVELVKRWGRSCLFRTETDQGQIWVKYGYRLPPGEECTLPILDQRHKGLVPRVVCHWNGAVAMETIPGEELTEEHSRDDWAKSAERIATIAAGERKFIGDWLRMGVRDRRPVAFRKRVEALLDSPVTRALPTDLFAQFVSLVPEMVARFESAFASEPTLVHQDSGCCNIHLTATGPVLFDWADVVVGHPVFSCDRLLDQTPAAYRESTIDAFIAPLGLTRAEFGAMRRSNVLHEIIRYHDELDYLPADCEVATSLRKSVASQISVLVNHELKRGSRV